MRLVPRYGPDTVVAVLDAAAPVPSFAVGEGYAAYRGPAIDVAVHRHAAFQVAIAVHGTVAIVDASGTCHRDAVLVVAPMARHRMLEGTDLLTFFIDPHCAFADRLRERHGAGVTVAPELRDLTEAALRPAGPSRALDPRIVTAMDAVSEHGARMPDVAARVGMSPPRLRALVRAQVGMPLLRWRAWVRLRVAAEALRDGRSIADAAITGGFADQAHLTRWMREMMGLTPTAALPALRGQPRRAT